MMVNWRIINEAHASTFDRVVHVDLLFQRPLTRILLDALLHTFEKGRDVIFIGEESSSRVSFCEVYYYTRRVKCFSRIEEA